jgi:hypothetical protein
LTCEISVKECLEVKGTLDQPTHHIQAGSKRFCGNYCRKYFSVFDIFNTNATALNETSGKRDT